MMVSGWCEPAFDADMWQLGTGLSDGFPPGGVDAHDVRMHLLEQPLSFADPLLYTLIKFLRNCPMIFWPLESK